MVKPLLPCDGSISSTITCSTRDTDGPRRSARSKRSTDSDSPSATTSTRAVVLVRDVAVKAFAPRRIEREVPEPHALHTPAHDESSSNAHPIIVPQRLIAGVSALTSAFPSLHVGKTWLSLAFLTVLTTGNLRGVKESARLFGVPVYAFLGVMLTLDCDGHRARR